MLDAHHEEKNPYMVCESKNDVSLLVYVTLPRIHDSIVSDQ